MDRWKVFLKNGDPQSKYLNMGTSETLEFFQMFFEKLTISPDIEDYKEKVQKQANILQPLVVLNPKELHSLSLLLINHGFHFFFFFYNSIRPIFFDI